MFHFRDNKERRFSQLMNDEQMILQQREKIEENEEKNKLKFRKKDASLKTIFRECNCRRRNFKSRM
jgi:hypothetical protein